MTKLVRKWRERAFSPTFLGDGTILRRGRKRLLLFLIRIPRCPSPRALEDTFAEAWLWSCLNGKYETPGSEGCRSRKRSPDVDHFGFRWYRACLSQPDTPCDCHQSQQLGRPNCRVRIRII